MTFFTETVNKHAALIQFLSNFVKKACAKRDISHGWDHMKLVAETSIKIAEEFTLTYDQTRLVIICAWLHDVDDHKYGNENKEVLDQFLSENFNEQKTMILAIIERVSFSREKKYGQLDWLTTLGKDGIIVRLIVSDADKLDAINIERCYHYKKMKGPQLSKKELWMDVIQHSYDKLFHLKDHYIISNIGKRLAEPLHNIMVADIEKIKANYDIPIDY
jgi:HD superfamily phosphodiesterase